MDSSNNITATKTLKGRLNNGETLYGLFLLSFFPTLAEISGQAGYDFVVVDMEHDHGGISQALSCLHTLAATHTAAILRLPENSPTWAKKAPDLGPDGLMFPMIDVETEEGVKRIGEISAGDGTIGFECECRVLGGPGSEKVKEMISFAEKAELGSGGGYLAGFAMPQDAPIDRLKRLQY
ncbi:hypothetical protein Pint_14837 [Pistacia integerrima]|uniref:Uncharacterized protein n=1 Tax=Pistacia integerrima TaxID=434235 RepID=A0ACC0ZEC0_9ROSI|nr:hypothetical protein Pint_14837 [Pistacia integerrima]